MSQKYNLDELSPVTLELWIALSKRIQKMANEKELTPQDIPELKREDLSEVEPDEVPEVDMDDDEIDMDDESESDEESDGDSNKKEQ